jgi:adenine-specific DNA methylase
MYGELSDFFYVWLRQILGERYDVFEAVRTPKREEAVVDPERNVEFERTEDHYVSLLGDIFSEAVRVLKPDGLVVFTFHHSSLEAWRALMTALDAAGLVVKKIHQVESEARGGTRVETSGGNLDAVIVCAPEGESLESGSVAEIREIVLQEALDQIQAIIENGYSLTEEEMRQITIATYLEVWSRYDVDSGLWGTLEE